ncbi:MAG: Flp pilus assembly protein CpaB [Clostridia bacterium]|nr:Flp pilus assembly protein CpaB [Clostridia bacterium]MBR2884758.1 Flp pilus assembly protein CpaB [Clostridia bacterium]
MKIFQNKIVVGVICIVIAAILAFFFLPSISKSKSNTEKIYAVKNAVAEGTKIEESMLVEKEVGSYGLPQSIIKDKDKIVGKYASCDITPDDLILSSKLSDYAANQKLDKVMSQGNMLVTVSLDSVASAVGNHLKSGDIISIVGYANDAVVVYEELKALEVYSIENENAEKLEDVENNEEAEHLASTVTLIANQVQAEKLIQAEYSGKVHAVFVKRGAVK